MSILATRETLTHIQDHPLVAPRLSWLASHGVRVIAAEGTENDAQDGGRSLAAASDMVAIPAGAGAEASAAQLEMARLLTAGWPSPASRCEEISLEAAAWARLEHEDVYEAVLEKARDEIRSIDAGQADILRLWMSAVLVDEEDRRQLLFQVSRLDVAMASQLERLIEAAPTRPMSLQETATVAQALGERLEAGERP